MSLVNQKSKGQNSLNDNMKLFIKGNCYFFKKKSLNLMINLHITFEESYTTDF